MKLISFYFVIHYSEFVIRNSFFYRYLKIKIYNF